MKQLLQGLDKDLRVQGDAIQAFREVQRTTLFPMCPPACLALEHAMPCTARWGRAGECLLRGHTFAPACFPCALLHAFHLSL